MKKMILVVLLAILGFSFSLAEAAEKRDKFNNKIYTAKRGDTFAEISQQEYGTKKFWWVIAEANHIQNPTKLMAGEEIIIPEMISGGMVPDKKLSFLPKKAVKAKRTGGLASRKGVAKSIAREDAKKTFSSISLHEKIMLALKKKPASNQPPGKTQETETISPVVATRNMDAENIPASLSKRRGLTASLFFLNFLITAFLIFVFWKWIQERKFFFSLLKAEKIEAFTIEERLCYFPLYTFDHKGNQGYETLHEKGSRGYLAPTLEKAQNSFRRSIKFYSHNLNSEDLDIQKKVEKIKERITYFQKKNRLFFKHDCPKMPVFDTIAEWARKNSPRWIENYNPLLLMKKHLRLPKLLAKKLALESSL